MTFSDEWANGAAVDWTFDVAAIYDGAEHYEILPERCTECVGHFDAPQCVAVCPVDCIPTDPDRVETPEQLMEKYQALTRAGAGKPA